MSVLSQHGVKATSQGGYGGETLVMKTEAEATEVVVERTKCDSCCA